MFINSEINEAGTTIYTFEDRGVAYTVFQKANEESFEVWSSRKALGRGVPTIRTFRNADEMGRATKALNNFSILLTA